MSALIVTLFLGLPLGLGASSQHDEEAPVEAAVQQQQPQQDALPLSFDAEAQDPVILKTQQKRPARRAARPQRKAAKKQPKNSLLSCFWNVFAPPGPYTMEIGLSGGLNFLETAYGGSNPNITGRLHGAYRIDPALPIQLFGAIDYSGYSQDAGPLTYDSRFLMFAAGGGLLTWISAVRLDLGAELGALLRQSSQSDGKGTDITQYTMQPAASLVGGMGFSLFGHVSLSLKGIARVRTDRDFSFAALDYMVLYGLEYYIDAKPEKLY